MMNLNHKSRSENAYKNLIIGLGSQFLILIATFVSRTIFIKQLGAEYLGINGLYTNLLMILSLAEMGIGNVMLYSLYRPIAEKDEAKVYALLHYYKKIYRYIALAVFLFGIILIPFLDFIANSEMPHSELVSYYLLFLLNSIASYFVAYKAALINADQQFHVLQTINTVTTLTKEILQIFFLIIANSYFLYLCILTLSTIVNNFIIHRKANQTYPFITQKLDLMQIDTTEIKENIKAMFVYRIGNILMNNTDAILISSIIGIVAVGYYSNYNLILTTVVLFIFMIAKALQSSVGNLNAEGNMEKSFSFFNMLLLFFNGITAFCSITLLLVLNDFITIWIGEEFLLSSGVVIAILINFYVKQIMEPIGMYRQTMGLFSQVKYVVFFMAIVNLVLSIVLGLWWGFAGILIATSISRVMTTFWYEPYILYRLRFAQPMRGYWVRQMYYTGLMGITAWVCLWLTQWMAVSLVNILLKVMVAFVVVAVVFLIATFRTKEFKLLLNYVGAALKR